MSQGTIRFEYQDSIGWITVENPKKLNAISLKMWSELDTVLAAMPENCRCIVLRGDGERAFVSGADISEFAERRRSSDDVRSYDEAADAAMRRLHEMPQPTVAMISGYCLGGGVALALSCDVRIAADNSQFAIPAARLGLGYGASGLKKLLDAVGTPSAIDIMASARRIGAEEAWHMGLVNQICAANHLKTVIEDYVTMIARNAPLTVRAAKRTIRELSTIHSAVNLDLCARFAAECFASEDYLEGARAFMEKREPRFTGR